MFRAVREVVRNMGAEQLMGGEEHGRAKALDLRGSRRLAVDRLPDPVWRDDQERQSRQQDHAEYRQADQGPPAPTVSPHVDGGDWYQQRRVGLRRRTEGKQREAASLPTEVQRRQGRHREHGREQVVSGQEQAAEQDGEAATTATPATSRRVPTRWAPRISAEQLTDNDTTDGHRQGEDLDIAREVGARDPTREDKGRKCEGRVLDREIPVRDESKVAGCCGRTAHTRSYPSAHPARTRRDGSHTRR